MQDKAENKPGEQREQEVQQEEVGEYDEDAEHKGELDEVVSAEFEHREKPDIFFSEVLQFIFIISKHRKDNSHPKLHQPKSLIPTNRVLYLIFLYQSIYQ